MDMKHARLLIVALVGLIPSAHALELSAGSRTAQAESAMEMRMQASTSILKAAIDQLKSQTDRVVHCNNASKFYRPGGPGADANGCVAPPSATPSPAPNVSIALVAEVESYNTTPSGWAQGQVCALTRVRATTTQDNHAHDCFIERSGAHSRVYATHEGKSGVHTACRMACFNIVQ